MIKIAKQAQPFCVLWTVFIAATVSTSIYLAGLFMLLFLFTCYFFRDPKRLCPQEANAAYSPADGRVTAVNKVVINNQKFIHISIFLSVFDCHINRVPVAGKMRSSEFFPGVFRAAYKTGIETINQRQETLFDTAFGELKVVQITGFIARRIFSWLSPNQEIKAGDKMGMIAFGSRTDLWLPEVFNAQVKVGDRLKAGISVVGLAKH